MSESTLHFFCGHLPRKQTVTPYRIGCNNMECAEKLCTKLQSCEQGYQEEQNASEGKNTLRMPFEFFLLRYTLVFNMKVSWGKSNKT